MNKKLAVLGLSGMLLYVYGKPLLNIGGSDGTLFPKDKTRIVLKSTYFSKDSAYNGDDKVDDATDRKMDIRRTFIMIRRGWGHNFESRVIIPYMNKKLTQNFGAKRGSLESNGLSDIILIGRYAILNQKKGDFAFLSLDGGIKLPTSKTNKAFTLPNGTVKHSNQLPSPMLQSGSGGYNYIAGIGFTKFTKKTRIDAHLQYIYTTKGDNDYEFGNKAMFNIGYSYAINNFFDVQIELDAFHSDKDKYKNVNINSTGGNFIYLTPGVHFRFNKHYDLSFGYKKMIIRDNNYDSSSNKGGLSEDYRFIARLGYNF